MVEKIEDMFIRFDRMHERDGHTQTDRQTHRHTLHDSIGRACITSRGKNVSYEAVAPGESIVSKNNVLHLFQHFCNVYDKRETTDASPCHA